VIEHDPAFGAHLLAFDGFDDLAPVHPLPSRNLILQLQIVFDGFM
jgi:hypothetical protein